MLKYAIAATISLVMTMPAFGARHQTKDLKEKDWATYHREGRVEPIQTEKTERATRSPKIHKTSARSPKRHRERIAHLTPHYQVPKPVLTDPVGKKSFEIKGIEVVTDDIPIIGPFLTALREELARITVDDYLCEVYRRMPVKKDAAGDFTWKDHAAAKRLNMNVCDYAIKGMHPDMRESLYHFGKIADAQGIQWSFLSAFRDNYRQSIAEGWPRAATCGSMHGGTCRTKGYGDGRAADVWVASGPIGALFGLIDRIGPKFGISRPMPGYDPAHVQVAGNWNVLAHAMRKTRFAALGLKIPEPMKVAELPPKKPSSQARQYHHKVRLAAAR